MKFLSEIEFNKWPADRTSTGAILLLIFSLIYLISSNINPLQIQLALMLLSIVLVLVFMNKMNQLVLWSVLLGIFITELTLKYFLKANHHFLLVYMIMLLIIYNKNRNWENFNVNIKWIVVIVLMFSAIQKMVSPAFISGDFFYLMMNTGKFFKLILNFTPDIQEIIASNASQIRELEQTNPNTLKSITLQPVLPNLDIISHLFAWLTIALELVIAMVFIWNPKHRISHFLFIILILGIFFTRLESGFLTLLTICGIWLTESRKFRTLYIILSIGFMGLIITKIGFH